MTVAAIHQPILFPWVPYLKKMHEADVFIFLDHIEMQPQSYMHKVDIGNGTFTVPLTRDTRRGPYKDVEIASGEDWRRKLTETVRFRYQNSRNFEEIYDEFCEILGCRHRYLANLCYDLVEWIMDELCIDTPVEHSLLLEPKHRSTRMLRELLDAVGADTYIMGASGRDYGDVEDFEGINIIGADYTDRRPCLDMVFAEERFK